MINEILIRLNGVDLENARNVCSLWYAIVDEWIGERVTTSTRKILHPGNPELSKEGIQLISEIGVKELRININNGNLLETPPTPLPSFKRPHLLRCLRLFGPVHPDLFRNLVNRIANLTIFQISLPALAHIEVEDLEHLNFPKLAVLKVASRRDAANEELLSLSLRVRFRSLFKEDNFSGLTNLIIGLHVEATQDMETTILLVKFVQAHSRLKAFSVTMLFPNKFNHVDETTFEDDLLKTIAEIKKSECCHSLKRLHVKGENIMPGYPHLEIWKEFILNASSLSYLVLNICPFSNEQLKTLVSRSELTLKVLVIYECEDALEGEGELNLDIFKSLKSIRDLFLVGKRIVSGVRHLPPTMEVITLSGTMRSEESDHILLNLPNLKTLVLVDVRNGQEGFGVRLETLRQFVENRRVKKLLIALMGVDPFPVERILNGDPNNSLELTVEPNKFIIWKLNEDGYYQEVSSDIDD